MAPEPPDADLIRAILAGQVELFEILVRRYQRLVATAALRMGVHRDEVADVTNEVFLKVYRNLATYRPEHALSTWLYRITTNAAVDHRRRFRPEAGADELPETLRDTRPSQAEDAASRERARLLQEALGRLPEHYRAPLLLAHVEELPIDEVARVMGLPEGTVKSRLFRARAMLKEVLERHYPGLLPGAGSARPGLRGANPS